VPIVGDAWGKFRRELRLFERFEIHTRMLGWDEKWLFVEHRFMSKAGRGRGHHARRVPLGPRHAAAYRNRARPRRAGTVAGIAGMAERWSDSCDGLSGHLRGEEGRALRAA
jgi:hypothetical protein